MLRAIARAGEGRIWVAHGNGLTRLDSDGGGAFHALEGPGSPMRALALDGAGKLWAGGDDGLFRIAPDGKVTPIALPQPDITVTALLADTGGGLWIGTVKRGLMRYDGGTWSLWGVAEGLPHPQVTALMRDQGGRVWAGTGFYSRGGAVRLDPGADGWRIGKVLTGADLAGAKVRSLYQDAAGRMWFGHEYDGLTIRQDGRSVAMIGLQDGLPDAEVTTILSDGAGGVWIGTLKGALHLPAQTIERLISAKPGESNDA
jgi:ligand-binding sensor domain-containing protein